MISLVIKSNTNATWSFDQKKETYEITISKNGYPMSLIFPDRILSLEEANRLIYREMAEFGEYIWKQSNARKYNNKSFYKYNNNKKRGYY